ncbi:hypothetical protein TRVL_09651 [Trypanosoma vivax]|nr:hypothetical protein TRVL_09651 [Trypanosoma vivax]
MHNACCEDISGGLRIDARGRPYSVKPSACGISTQCSLHRHWPTRRSIEQWGRSSRQSNHCSAGFCQEEQYRCKISAHRFAAQNHSFATHCKADTACNLGDPRCFDDWSAASLHKALGSRQISEVLPRTTPTARAPTCSDAGIPSRPASLHKVGYVQCNTTPSQRHFHFTTTGNHIYQRHKHGHQ